ncbi:MAG: S8 family peptidase [Gaiellaceae bacterium]
MVSRSRSAAIAVIGCACALAVAGGTSRAQAGPAPPAADAVPGELIVGWKVGVSRAERARALDGLGVRRTQRLGRIRAALVKVAPDRVQAALAELRRDRRVRYVEPNYLLHAADHPGVPNDPAFHELWGLDNFGQVVAGVPGTPDADVDAEEAWAVTTGSAGVVVGVLDTGIDFGHPDLASAKWVNSGEDCAGCRTNGVDDDGNGYVDDWRGWDFVSNDNNPTDDNGHGTHVAGTIGARGNDGVGVVGVNWDVRLLALKFLNASGSGTTADAVEALQYATAKGVPVTNNSWAGSQFSQALLDALRQADAAGSLFVAAAGNSSANLETTPDYPVAYGVPSILTVAATDSNDVKAWFSSYGMRSVDLAAPGVNVYSSWTDGTYRHASGTSMATPHVAGAAALAKAAFPGASGVGLRALLLRTVDAKSGLAPYTLTGGRLNAGSAVACAGEPKAWIESPAPGFTALVGDAVKVTVLAARCADPSGVAVSATVNGAPLALAPRGDGLYTATFAAVEAGGLTISVDAEAGGLVDSRSVSGVVSSSYTIGPGGDPLTLSLAANENANVRFDGVAGQRIALELSGVTIGPSTCCSSRVSVLRPDGTALMSPAYFGTSGGFVDTRTLPASGTYTIVVDPQGSSAGNVTLTLHDVPADAAATIVPGGPAVSTGVTTPGQNARVTFQGVAGRRVSLELTGVTIGTSTCCGARVSILRPSGTALVSPAYFGTSGGFVDTRTLPESGAYTIVLDPNAAATGSGTVTLHDVPPDAAGTIVPGGPAVSTGVTTPGQNARIAFEGVAGRRVSLELTGVTIGTSTCCGARVSILRPSGTALVSPAYFGTSGGFVDAQALPESGTYTILLDPDGKAVGSATATLHDVPPDVTGSVATGGDPLSVTMTTPGQNARITFAGTAGRAVTLRLSAVTIGTSTCCGARVSILRPDGTALVSPTYFGTSGKTLTATPATTGTYTVVVDPQKTATGAVTLELD